jgi:hypothetical protein
MHNKELLYDLLEECGGISEFILPLVVNGHFGQGVTWLHQPWAEQIPLGASTFLIGDNSAAMSGVSSVASYYLDEGLSYGKEELSHGVEMTLLSCHDDYFEKSASVDDDHSSGVKSAADSAWVLDVCLDYFTVTNPYLGELEAALRQHGGPSFSLLSAALSAMFHALRFRSHQFEEGGAAERETETGAEAVGGGAEYSLARSRQEREEFLEIMQELLEIDDDGESDETRRDRRDRFLALFDGGDSNSDSNSDSGAGSCGSCGGGGGDGGDDKAAHPAAVRFLDMLPSIPKEVKRVVNDIGEESVASLWDNCSCYYGMQLS